MFRKDKSLLYICFTVLVFLIGAGVYHLNLLFPVFADDIGFAFVSEMGVGLTRKISNVCDILETQYSQYHVWGGRCVVHFILQSILLLGQNIANILNSVAYLALSLLIYAIVNKGNELKPLLFLLINISLLVILPVFLETVLWLSGSVNYTWGMLIVLLFIYPFYNHFINENISHSRIYPLIMFFAGIIAGWTNENTALSMIILIAFLLLYLKITKKNIPLWIISGLVGACIGYLIMILAPGNYMRSAAVSYNLGLDQVSVFKLFKIRLYNLISGGGTRIISYLAIYLLFAGLYWRNRKLQDCVKPLLASLGFMCASVSSYCILFPAPTFPERAMFGVAVYALIAIGILFSNLHSKDIFVKIVKISFITIITVWSIFSFKINYTKLVDFSEISKAREDLISKNKEKGVLNIVFTEKETMTPDKEVLTTDSLNFYNVYYAKYYDINTIVLEKEPHW